MKALVVHPGQPNSASLREVPEPDPHLGEILVETLAVGVCGTDREIIAGEYGAAPAEDDYLILGHESLGRVLEAPADGELQPGDLVAGIVRRPDPVPCPSCAVGEWDMCTNEKYTEHGIKGLHGFCAERFRVTTSHAVKLAPNLENVGVLVEPASVVAKAWQHIERIGNRAHWSPSRVLVTGAGPIGLLAALLGVQRGFDVHVLDLAEDGLKPELVEELGATYHHDGIQEACCGADIVVECTGVGRLVYEATQCNAHSGIVCLTGISSGQRAIDVDWAELNRRIVLENDVVFGTVNANREHYELAADALKEANNEWLERLITRRIPIDNWQAILERPVDDVKTVITFD
ncbi:glucose 1-dehydrogenase [Thalassoroseus pseudoceratinae]|uniref:glucose 1-dehydrogenase n=1 Tax=Thalassoroseus pseudoceratinae TaxID=2713176 RepID=UPI00142455A0|nr:glucose 1-dehydrogenase [Thalassoroseus pseudoceratinae]